MIDLSRHLTSVDVLPDQKLIKVGGGYRYEAVEKAAMEHRIMLVSGTVNHVSRPRLPLTLV